MSDENWDSPWDSPGPPPKQPDSAWNGGSKTFTNSNRGDGGRFRAQGGSRGGWRQDNRNRSENENGWGGRGSSNSGFRRRGGSRGGISEDGWQRTEVSDDRGGNNGSGGWGGGSRSGGWGGNSGSSGYSGNSGSGGWGDDNYQNRRRSAVNDKCEIIKVPSKMVGRIIGKGGMTIEGLKIRSEARINVTKETDGDDTIIKIFGDDESINKAKELIDELLEPPKPKAAPIVFTEHSDLEPSAENKTIPPTKNLLEYYKECEAKALEEWNKRPPIVKNFYQEHPEVTAMTDEEVHNFREQSNNIVVARTFPKEDSRPIPKPVKTFEQAFHNYPDILEEIRKAGFEKPSPIQCQAWPVLLSGEDLIGIAQTGTGKTLAFLLPALIHIDGQTVPREERGGPTVLIMAPTRELALQIDREVKKYHYRGITSVCVYGGGDRRAQVDVVTRGVDIVIATPGRMNDLYQAGHLHVESITYAVLDEADRMLDMGFEPQIRKVMYSLRPNRQCIMTSATWPPGVRRLADSYMDDPIQVYVGSLDLAATHTVTQVIHLVDEKEKEDIFFDFVYNMGPDDKIIVFCGTKAKADYLSVELVLKNISCASLHGNRDQSDREQAVADIADGTVKILVATDVASRGLDIDDITHVLNYDFPKNIEEYVHRVGRTGRAGKTGESISYFTRNDWIQAAELIKILEEAQQYVPEELYSMAERYQAMQERRENERANEPRRGGNRFGRGNRRY